VENSTAQPLEWYEEQMNQAAQSGIEYAKSVGGADTIPGKRFLALFHDFVNIVGSMYAHIFSLKLENARLKHEAFDTIAGDDMHNLLTILATARENGDSGVWGPQITDSDKELAQKILDAGWLPPSKVAQIGLEEVERVEEAKESSHELRVIVSKELGFSDHSHDEYDHHAGPVRSELAEEDSAGHSHHN
jgi:hypothetical protein